MHDLDDLSLPASTANWEDVLIWVPVYSSTQFVIQEDLSSVDPASAALVPSVVDQDHVDGITSLQIYLPPVGSRILTAV